MTGGGGGRCKRRRKAMAANSVKIECIDRNPNLSTEITEKPLCSENITELPLSSSFEFDFYSQARKALAFRCPFDTEDSSGQGPAASVSGANTLPSRVSSLLSRHSDGRKRQKKLHSGSEKKSSSMTPGKAKGASFWFETEEYFRELSGEDVERLEKVSSLVCLGKEKCLLIPSLDKDDNSHERYDAFYRMLANACEDEDSFALERNGIDIGNGKVEVKEISALQEESGPSFMNVDGDDGEIQEVEIKEESNGGKIEKSGKDYTSFSGVEWLLGSRSKIYLASERPSKKRKLLGMDAGLEKLLVSCPVEGLDSVCHYCSYGEMGNPLNCLIKCGSCGMVVHQRCYGVQEDVDSSWLCSWCKWKNGEDISTEKPCLLCPKPGGALKPVHKRGLGSKSEGSEVGFTHLFCCQWMPEVYLENTRTMEPIMNFDELNETRKKLICYLCKVKWGACVRCSNGACRTSFHPICAREARHRMEIWGKLGCDEVELRAFCSKHSEVQYDSCSQNAGKTSLTGDSISHVSKHQQVVSTLPESHKLKTAQRDCGKLAIHMDTDDIYVSKVNDTTLNTDLQDNAPNAESHPESGDALEAADKEVVNRNDNEVKACSGLNLSMILKKLIDLGKVNAKDVASEIGVSPESLNTILTDNCTVPDLRYKLLKWMKNHAFIGSLQKTLKVRIRSPAAPKAEADVAEGASAISLQESDISDDVPVKSVPPRRRTKSSLRIVKDDKSCASKDKTSDEATDGEDLCLLGGEDSNGVCRESLSDVRKKMLVDCEQQRDNSANNSIIVEDELSRALAQSPSEDVMLGESKQSEQISTCAPVIKNVELMRNSCMHPFIYTELLQTNNVGREDSQFAASSSSGLCCNNYDAHSTSGDWISRCKGMNLDHLVKTRNGGVLKLSPTDEVEGELIFYQQKILRNALRSRRITDDLISKVVRSLPREIDAAGKRKWDAVLVSQYNHELKEAKKQGRKERRHKEAQAVLAAATAAAAGSSRISSLRKDTLEDDANQEDLRKIKITDKDSSRSSAVAKPSSDRNSNIFQISSTMSKEHPRTCEICRRSETILNPILVCSSCKVAVHLDCYRSVKSTLGPWYCELCEDIFSSSGSGAQATNSTEKPYFVAECGVCGGTASAFRKSVDGQWIHALCAEWVLESTYRRGQVNPIEGMETMGKGIDACAVCCRKQGVCLKCSYGHCQSTFHPTCARSAGFYMTVKTNGGKLQHKAYCEKHSVEQKAKADTQKHGIEEFKSLKQVRVELERLRLLCERIVKREKLKRELVMCSHNILASSRDSVLSALARHPFYRPEVSSESATTSIKGYTDDYKSGSETLQRSDDVTVDSTVAGKRRVKLPISVDSDRKTDDSFTSQNLYTLRPVERVSFSGKQIQRLAVTSRNLSEDMEKQSRYRKHPETFEKELIMTSDEASMKNQRLPKGFVYVPIRCVPKDKDTVQDTCSQDPPEHNG